MFKAKSCKTRKCSTEIKQTSIASAGRRQITGRGALRPSKLGVSAHEFLSARPS